MRIYYLIILFIIGQSDAQIADYKATYEYVNSNEMAYQYSGTSYLYFNDSLSISEFKLYQNHDGNINDRNNNQYVLLPTDEEGLPIYTNLKKGIQIFKSIHFRNKIIVTDSIIDMNWQLQDERDVVNGYSCLTAKGSHAGRNYTAWYTTEIPYPFGPYKFHGLPGLIVKIQSEDKNITMNLESIKPIKAKDYQIKPPSDGVKLSWDEYEEAYFNIIEEYNSTSSSDYRKDPQTETIEQAAKYDLLGRYEKRRNRNN